jgi:hypothetical protein
MLRSTQSLDSRLKDGGEARRPRSTQKDIVLLLSSFILEAEYIPEPSAAGRMR